ncbi:RluA family pseudouridine synthase [Pusillimonas sp. DMV24BSW_D]|uniref:RluA family pseudouridine synthase n=1 Tax=Neopusillimonas aestuarii TaxID=2716226 RepID=UPI00140BAFB7|nr:RluA family pseudouridine synthase [Pusillimonas sp. DMV24BSW_D]QIM50009.1 RluA family pseudouridine synthase [Pusillimonas sp. DMV24BSW_D]
MQCVDSSPEVLTFRLPITAGPDRLDKVLAQHIPEHSRSRLQSWVEAGQVWVNGTPAKVRQKVGPGDHIEVHVQPAPEQQAFTPENVDFEVVAQSPDWVVVNKPAGLVTHPGAGNWSGTLLNGLLFRFPELASVARAGIVHRLDKDTSGLLVVARNETTQTHLVRLLQARSVKRVYAALVHGNVIKKGTVNRPIGRDPHVPVKMTVERPIAPKEAITHYAPLAHGSDLAGQAVSHVQCELETGRTHQIRVHMASIRHPLVADVLYGGKCVAGAQRQMLHAHALSFVDPASNALVSFEAPLPSDFKAVMEQLSWDVQ